MLLLTGLKLFIILLAFVIMQKQNYAALRHTNDAIYLMMMLFKKFGYFYYYYKLEDWFNGVDRPSVLFR